MILGQWSALGVFGGAVAEAINFVGVINNRAISVDGALSINVATNFAGTEAPFTYSLISGVLPAGVSLNTSTGEISGIPTALGLTSGIIIRATDTELDTAETNAFNIDVVDGVVIPVERRDTQSHIAEYLRAQGFVGSNNDVIMQWLESFGHVNAYNDNWDNYLTSQGYTTGSFADKYAAWRKGVGV